MRIFGVLAAGIRWVCAAQVPASAVVHSIISRLVMLIASVATGIIVARSLGPIGRGAAAAVGLWPLVISSLMTLGVPAALRYGVRRRLDTPETLLSSAALIIGVLGISASLIGYITVPRFLVQYSPSVITFGQRMMILAPLILWNLAVQAYYESQGKFKWSNALGYVQALLTLSGVSILLALHKLSPYSVTLIYALPSVLVAFTTFVQLRKILRLPDDLSKQVRSLLHYGGRAYGMDILNALAGQIDQAIVVGLLSAANFGLYAVATNGARISSLLAGSLNTVLLPTASGLDPKDAIALVSQSGRLVFACTALVGGILILALPVLVPIAYGQQYLPIVGLTRLLVVAVLFAATADTLSQVFMATGRPEIATVLQGTGVCTTVVLMLLLIPNLGLTGAGYALDISSALRLALVMLSYPVMLNHGMPRIIPKPQELRNVIKQLRQRYAGSQ